MARLPDSLLVSNLIASCSLNAGGRHHAAGGAAAADRSGAGRRRAVGQPGGPAAAVGGLPALAAGRGGHAVARRPHRGPVVNCRPPVPARSVPACRLLPASPCSPTAARRALLANCCPPIPARQLLPANPCSATAAHRSLLVNCCPPVQGIAVSCGCTDCPLHEGHRGAHQLRIEHLRSCPLPSMTCQEKMCRKH